MEYYHWYFVVINVAAFLMYGWDKLCACRNWWRLSEFALLFVAALGGGIGALLGMLVLRHKTLHWKFRIGVPVLLLLQVAAVVWLHLR